MGHRMRPFSVHSGALRARPGLAGRTGWVHEAVLADYPNLTMFELYMSGPPAMVFAGKHAFTAAGLLPDHMYSDVFEWAKDKPEKGE